MSSLRKRLKLSPSKPRLPLTAAARPVSSHDALLLTPPPAGGGAQEEEEEYLLVEEDTTDSSLIIIMEDSQVEVKAARRRPVRKRRKLTEEEERGGASESEEEAAVEIDRRLDQSLETKSKQHNLTTVNVRNIIHEVITNEHVVAMMKAAINETEAVPPFEPKMTRSKFKEVVEKGVVIPAWNISPIKKTSDANKAPQFVDIPLADEDSSDEEYRPDEDEEDETAEDTFQESDMESTASSPRGSRVSRVEEDSCSPWQMSRSRSRRLRTRNVSMGPPPPPKAPPPRAATDSSFLEKLHAVEEELAVCLEPYQPLSESEDEVGLMAYRTRSKRPLRDVPLGRLEAELRAPDITPDMYDSGSAHEDRDWTDWLRGLMTSDMDNEEECDDEDDPEYNFLADIDEPDVEDYRDDKAVRITKKEVNELMEELFETLKEDLAGQEVEDEGHEDEEEPQEEPPAAQTHTPEEQHNRGHEDGPITERLTVRQQLASIRRRQTHTPCNTHTHVAEPYTLRLGTTQRGHLQQQLQQHVQLLTQIHLLSSSVVKLQSEAETTRQFLFELDLLAQRGELLMSSGHPGFCSVFRASNLRGALQLLDELQKTPITHQQRLHPPDARGHMRCYPVLPAELAWIFATRPVFLYPELLPCASLDPALYCPRRTAAFTAAEDCLLVLGLRNMEGSCDPAKLVSQFLLRKTLVQVRRRILQCCRPGSPDNIVKAFRYQRVLRPMMLACRRVEPSEQRPPVEREEEAMPLWLLRSLPVIYPTIRDYNCAPGSASLAPPSCRSGGGRHMTLRHSASHTYSFPPGTRYPPRLPTHLDFRRIGFMLLPLPPPPPKLSPLPDGLKDSPPSSPLPDGQVDSSALLDRLKVSSPSSPLPDRDVDSSPSSPLLDRLKASSPFSPHPDGQVVSSPLHEGQVDSSPLPDRQVDSSPSSPLPDRQVDSSPSSPLHGGQVDSSPLPGEAHSPPRVLLRRLLLSRTDAPADIITTSAISMTTTERIRNHYQTLTSLRGSRRRRTPSTGVAAPPPPGGPTPCQEEGNDVIRMEEEEEEEEESEVLLALSESSPSSTGSEADPEEAAAAEEEESVLQLQEESSDDDDDQREREDEAFAHHYLLRVCDAVVASPGVLEQLLQLLDQSSAAGPSGAPAEVLYDELKRVLRPWPQLLRDFAAFLSRSQAHRCGLLVEQQLFERSRRFLRRLGRSLGEGSSPYQQVVSVLQGSSAPSPEHMEQVSALLSSHAHLQQEFWDFFRQLHGQPSPIATSSETTEMDRATQNPPDRNRKRTQRAVCAKNIFRSSNGEKVVIWTREADRAILTACQQRGANQRTFRQVSTQLGNKTAHQVSCRFHDLMTLFHSAFQKGQPISRQDAARD